jgi:hypothetical protein
MVVITKVSTFLPRASHDYHLVFGAIRGIWLPSAPYFSLVLQVMLGSSTLMAVDDTTFNRDTIVPIQENPMTQQNSTRKAKRAEKLYRVGSGRAISHCHCMTESTGA